MIEITQQNFETELIAESMQQPVLLDIWAPWCGPCRTLGPLLEKLETAYEGRFRLAKLNSDEQPEIAAQLSQMFGVRSIPFCVLFAGGQPVDGFVGALPESEIRQFLDGRLPTFDELEAQSDLEEASALADEGDTHAALAKLEQAVAVDPANDEARADLVKLLLEAGELARAKKTFGPVAATAPMDRRIAALGHWIAACEKAASARSPEALTAAISADRRDFEARFELAQCHFAAGRFTDAMDELLEIVMRDKGWRDELARKNYVAMLELMSKPPQRPASAEAKGAVELTGKAAVASADPVLDQYRRKLSMALF